MPTFATKELEKVSLGEGSNGVVGKPTTKRISLLWAYGKHLITMRWNYATNGNNGFWIDMNKEERNYFTGRIKELGSFICTIIATILRESFRWNMTQDNSNEEIDGFKSLIPDNLSPMKQEGNCQGWHNTISKDKVERIALQNVKWRILEV